jgi:hypothetical protein
MGVAPELPQEGAIVPPFSPSAIVTLIDPPVLFESVKFLDARPTVPLVGPVIV